MPDELVVGDRVMRKTILTGHVRRGTVSSAYRSRPDGAGKSIRLYAVTWDDSGELETGYLGVNLERLEP